MEISVLDRKQVHYEETNEYQLEINGEEHIFRVFDSPDERLFWFDDEIYYSTDDEVMENLTVQDLLDWI